jgi:hypothetical protein
MSLKRLPEEIRTGITEAATRAEAVTILNGQSAKALKAVADLLYIDVDNYPKRPDLIDQIIREARA